MKKELFEFKKKSQDFIVEEILPWELNWNGDVLFVYFEKINANTMDVVEYLSIEFKVSQKSFGIWWLKDKDAITRQRICVYKSLLQKIWGESRFLDTLAKIVRIIKYDWHNKTLNLSEEIKNKFYIKLRGKKTFSQMEKDEIKKDVLDIMEKWVPNYFWAQRFGINYRNINMWKNILLSKHSLKNKFETKFKLQAYASFLFNKLVDFRLSKSGELLDWDIFKIWNNFWFWDLNSKSIKVFENKRNEHFFYFPDNISSFQNLEKHDKITLPVFGFNTLLCKPQSKAGIIEQQFIKEFNLNEKNLKMFQSLGIYGLRRNFWLQPEDYQVNWKWDEINISFVLGKGNYASVIIEKLWK